MRNLSMPVNKDSKMKRFGVVFVAIISAWGLTLGTAARVFAAVNNPAPAAQVSFTFDDAYLSHITEVAPLLAKYGLKATAYIPTGCVESQGTCEANEDSDYMSWNQVASLQNNFGWEIGAHTVNHRNLPQLTPAERENELIQSNQAFAAHGIAAPVTFASPEGDYDPPSLALVAKYYAAHRGFHDVDPQNWPYNDYILQVKQVQAGVSVDEVKAAIDQAILNKQWLILTLHDIKQTPSSDPEDFEYSIADLDAVAAYVKSKKDAGQLNVNIVKDGLVTSDTNLLGNSSFDSGIGGGWTTDSPATITHNNGSKGNYPSPVSSVKLVSSNRNTHLFSPKVAVTSNGEYLIRSFQSIETLAAGEFGYYIDEYDANGSWVSGQYKGGETFLFPKSKNFTYTPSSANVKQASLQYIVPANSGITAYVDNVQWFLLHNTPTPPPPPPGPTNLVPNGTFDNGIADGWSTDLPARILADNTNNGSPANPVNSVRVVANARNGHLFAPLVAVDSTKTYNITTFVKLQQLTGGEIGFYIDEYNDNNEWISGQYKGGVNTVSTGDVGFNYQPSSANVKKVRHQVIVTGNSGIRAYVDHVRFFQL